MNELCDVSLFIFVVYCFWTLFSVFESIYVLFHAVKGEELALNDKIFLVVTITSHVCFWFGAMVAFSFRWFYWG